MKKLKFFGHFFILLIQTQLFQCHREERTEVAISSYRMRLLRCARNDIVKIYIAFILVFGFLAITLHPAEGVRKESLMVK